MADFKIISDSSCDLPEEMLRKYDIDLVPYLVTFDGVHYYKDGVDISLDEFYRRLSEKGVFPKTSLPPIQDYVDKFRVYLAQGLDVVCVCLTGKFSGSFQSATNAASILSEEFPERRVKVVDSRLATYLQGIFVMDMAEYKKEGKTLDEVCQLVESYNHDCRGFITVDCLDHLQNGGRIGKASALAGSLLNIKPIISFENGELIPYSKVRGRQKALNEIVSCTLEKTKDDVGGYRLFALYNGCPDEANKIIAQLEEMGHTISGPIPIGITISVHTGPSAVAVGYYRKRPGRAVMANA